MKIEIIETSDGETIRARGSWVTIHADSEGVDLAEVVQDYPDAYRVVVAADGSVCADLP